MHTHPHFHDASIRPRWRPLNVALAILITLLILLFLLLFMIVTATPAQGQSADRAVVTSLMHSAHAAGRAPADLPPIVRPD